MYRPAFGDFDAVSRLTAHQTSDRMRHTSHTRSAARKVTGMRRSLALGAVALLAVSAAACSVGSNTGSTSSGDKEITFLTFETPNLTPAYWDAAIKRVTDKNPGIKVKKLVAPTADGRT